MSVDESGARQSAEDVGKRSLSRLLDPAFGFFVWAAHFLLIYISQATACVLGFGGAGAQAQWLAHAALAALTLAALLVIGLHALRAHRRGPELREGFLNRLTIGNDAIAAVGVAWQLYPILMLPLCR